MVRLPRGGTSANGEALRGVEQGGERGNLSVDATRAAPESGLHVGTATADYVDLVDARRAVSEASAKAFVSRDASLVASAWDKKNALLAREALGNKQLEQSARAYASGDVGRARALATKSASTLRKAAIDFEDEDLQEQAKNVDRMNDVFGTAEPSSVDGRRSVKQAKEWYLENVR